MSAARIAILEALETDVKAELELMAKADRTNQLHNHEPITDGVVNEALYLASSPKMMWILKEPWEEDIEGAGVGGWSVTKGLIPKKLKEGTIGNRGTYPNMAYVTYSVLNGFLEWNQIPWISENPDVGNSLRNIAYINVSKHPGEKISYAPFIRECYKRNRDILRRQIATIAPDVIIGGSTLLLFLEDLCLDESELIPFRSVKVCNKKECLYIDAYHPANRFSPKWYVGDIVAAIKQYRQNWEFRPHLPPNGLS